MRIKALILVILLLGSAAAAQDAERPANQSLTFFNRSPVSSIDEISRRIGWPVPTIKKSFSEFDYDLSKESFEAYIPKSYTGEKPFGLLVWVSAGGGRGSIPRGWHDILDKHNLIWLAPNNVGNDRAPPIRMGLAIDAAHNARSKFNLDPNRIYIAGGSGGGRISSMLGVCYPDVFTGGCYFIGANFYRQLPSTEQPNQFFRKTFDPPSPALFNQAKKNSRHALITGETDANREQTKVNSAAMKKDGFLAVQYFEVPGMGHQLPNPEWFDKAIVFLDTPVASSATRPAKPQPFATNPAEAPDEPERLLRLARVYLSSNLPDQARQRLEKIIKDHPTSPAAREARQLLADLEKK